MIAKELISGLIPPLKLTDTGDRALIWMHEFNINHLPVIDGEQFVGLLSEDDIMDLDEPTNSVEKYRAHFFKPIVRASAHVYEVIKAAGQFRITAIPIVDDEEKYVGVVPIENLVKYFASLNSLNENGGILVLEMMKRDYSMAEIAKIVESNNAVVLSAQVASVENTEKLEVTLKLNVMDIKHITATFERFNYEVKASFQEEGYADQIKDRYDSLMNYLNI